MLPPDDCAYLAERFPGYSQSVESNMLCVVLPGYALPDGLAPTHVDLLLRLGPGYPDVPPDMWWFDPAVQRMDGQAIRNTHVAENHLGRTWQRWSRHLTPGQWRPGVDSVQTFLAILRNDLDSAAS